MVENVGKDGLEFVPEALVDVDVLSDLEVDVPEEHATKDPSAAGETQNGVADAVPNGDGVGEEADVAGRANVDATCGLTAGHVVVSGAAEVVGAGENGVSSAAKLTPSASAKAGASPLLVLSSKGVVISIANAEPIRRPRRNQCRSRIPRATSDYFYTFARPCIPFRWQCGARIRLWSQAGFLLPMMH